MGKREMERRHRLEKLARVCADMITGMHTYSEGSRQMFNPDGSLTYNKSEALRAAGFSVLNKNSRKRLFSDPYFDRCLDLEVKNRTTGYCAAVEKVQRTSGDLSAIVERMFKRVRDALDRDEIPDRDILRYAPQWARFLAEVEGKIHASGQEAKNLTLVYNDLRNLPPGARERIVDTSRAFLENKLKELESGEHQAAAADDEAVLEGEVVE